MWESFVAHLKPHQTNYAMLRLARTLCLHSLMQVLLCVAKQLTPSVHQSLLDFCLRGSEVSLLQRHLPELAAMKYGQTILISSSKEIKEVTQQNFRQHCNAHCATTVRPVLVVKDDATSRGRLLAWILVSAQEASPSDSFCSFSCSAQYQWAWGRLSGTISVLERGIP